MIEYLPEAIALSFSWPALIAVILGSIVGVVVGVLPGLGSALGCGQANGGRQQKPFTQLLSD